MPPPQRCGYCASSVHGLMRAEEGETRRRLWKSQLSGRDETNSTTVPNHRFPPRSLYRLRDTWSLECSAGDGISASGTLCGLFCARCALGCRLPKTQGKGCDNCGGDEHRARAWPVCGTRTGPGLSGCTCKGVGRNFRCCRRFGWQPHSRRATREEAAIALNGRGRKVRAFRRYGGNTGAPVKASRDPSRTRSRSQPI